MTTEPRGGGPALDRAARRARALRPRRDPITDTELEHVGAATATLGLAVGRLTELVEAMRGLALNHVVYSGTRILDAAGGDMLDASTPCASVTIINYGAATVTVAQQPRQDTAPRVGPGIFDVGPSRMVTVPLAGTVWSFYGTAATRVGVILWTRPQPAFAGPVA
jgi:hypothetical protein